MYILSMCLEYMLLSVYVNVYVGSIYIVYKHVRSCKYDYFSIVFILIFECLEYIDNELQGSACKYLPSPGVSTDAMKSLMLTHQRNLYNYSSISWHNLKKNGLSLHK